MARDIPKEIAQLVPVDAVAGRVTSSGSHWDPKRPDEELSTLPLPTKRVDFSIKGTPFDLTGQRFGRLEVVGLSVKPARWVVRCDCGTYSHRKSRVLKSDDPSAGACRRCIRLQELRTGSRTGISGEVSR